MAGDETAGHPAAPDIEVTRRSLDGELREVASAISLVASGGATRVTVAGMRFGDQVLAASRDLATSRGVVLEALWHAEDAGADITIRRPA